MRSAVALLGRFLRRVSAASAGLYVVLLLGASALALWGWLAPGEVAPLQDGTPFTQQWPLAVAVWVTAAALIAPLLLSLILRRVRKRFVGDGEPAQILGNIVGLFAVIAALGALRYIAEPSLRGVMSRHSWLSLRMPLTVLAVWLTILAVAAAFVAVPGLFSRSYRVRRVSVLVGAVCGVVVVAVGGFQGWRAGATRQDATTAALVAIPAAPTALGAQRFSITIGKVRSVEVEVQAAAAGAGFVVRHRDRVTAYGPDGQERWHYQRTAPAGVSAIASIRVFNAENTILVAHNSRFVVALDSITGRQLWSSWDDDELMDAFGNQYLPLFSMYLMTDHGGGTTWTRFDTRTGQPMWNVDAPDSGCGDRVDRSRVDTVDRIVSVTTCWKGNDGIVRMTALDPATGKQLSQTSLLSGIRSTGDRAVDRHATAIARTGGDWFVWSYLGGPTVATAAAMVAVNAVTGETRNLPGDLQFRPTAQPGAFTVADEVRQRPPGGGGFFEYFPHLFTSSGVPQCALPQFHILSRSGLGGTQQYAEVGKDMLFATYDTGERSKLRVVDPTDCSQVSEWPVDGFASDLIKAPGVVLLVRSDRDGVVHVDGY